MANEIRCGEVVTSLVWSFDGSMVAVTLSSGSSITDVETYHVFSGAQLFTNRFKSRAYIYLWAHEKSFRLMEIALHGNLLKGQSLKYSISEIGPNLSKIESSSLTMEESHSSPISKFTFSPSTRRITILDLNGTISVFNIRTSHCLLRYSGKFTSFHIFPDGNCLAGFREDNLYMFKCVSDSYALIWASPFGHKDESCFQISPTSSSILSQHDGILQVRRLSDLPITPETDQQYTAISRSGRRIATVNRSKTTVTIIDLHSRAPSQFLDTGFVVQRLAITGNVLVAIGSWRAAGWLLTEEGTIDGVFGDQRARGSDSKWTSDAPWSEGGYDWDFRVEGKVGVIQRRRRGEVAYWGPLFFHIETGYILQLAPEPQHSSLETSPEISISTGGRLHHNLAIPLYLTPLKDSWLIPYKATPEAVWVIDPEGRRRFWIPVEWRKLWDPDCWHHQFTTLLGETRGGQSVVIKF